MSAKNLKMLAFVLFCICPFFLNDCLASDYNLLEIYELASKRSHALKISDLRVLEADKTAYVSLGRMLPSADINFAEQKVNPFSVLEDGQITEKDRELETEFVVSQPIFDPAVYKQWNIAKQRVKMSVLNRQYNEQFLIVNIINNYFQLLKGQNSLEIIQARVKTYKELKNTEQQKYKNGLGTMTDFFIAEKELEISKIQEYNIKKTIETRKRQLEILTGVNIDSVIPLKEHLFIMDSLLTLDYEWKEMLKDNIELKAKEIEEDIKDIEINILKWRYFPTLYMSYTYEGTDIPGSEPEKTFALTFSCPLFSGFSVMNSILKEKYSRQIVTLQKDRRKQELEIEIESRYTQALASKKNYFDYQKILEIMEKVFDDISILHKKGRKTLTDLTNAEKDKTEVLLNINNSLIDFIIHISNLYNICGKMDLDRLMTLNKFLINKTP